MIKYNTADDTARFYPDEWKALQRCLEYSTVPDPLPDDGPGQDTDIDGVPQGCRSCGDRRDTYTNICRACLEGGACAFCGGDHHIQRCGLILAALGLIEPQPVAPPYAALAA